MSVGAHVNGYDRRFWDEYADSNDSRYDAEFAGRVRYTALELGCASVLEIGCGTGIDLRLLKGCGIRVYGLDPNQHAVAIARSGIPSADFVRGMITKMPFADSSVDLVFTHRLLNYLDDETVSLGMREMHRVAGKHVMSCEWSGRDGTGMGDRRVLRDMSGRWGRMGAHVMADAPVHAEGGDGARHADHLSGGAKEPGAETRITLVRVA